MNDKFFLFVTIHDKLTIFVESREPKLKLNPFGRTSSFFFY